MNMENGTNPEQEGLSEEEFFEQAFAAALENNDSAKRKLHKNEILGEGENLNQSQQRVTSRETGVKAKKDEGPSNDEALEEEREKEDNNKVAKEPVSSTTAAAEEVGVLSETVQEQLQQGELEEPSANKEAHHSHQNNNHQAHREPTLEELKREVEQLKFKLHQAKSNAGRISAYQRQIADLKNQLAILQAAAQPPSSFNQNESNEAAGKERKAPSYQDNPKFKKIKEADPDLAEALSAVLEDQGRDLKEYYEQRISSVASAQAKASREQYVRNQQQLLREWVPNLDSEIIPSPHFQYFFKNASNGVRALLESEEAEDVLEGLRLYDNWLVGLQNQHRQQQQNQPKVNNSNGTNKVQPALSSAVDISKLNDSRSRRLAATDVSSSQQAVSLVAPEEDENSLFEKAFEATLKRITPQKDTRR